MAAVQYGEIHKQQRCNKHVKPYPVRKGGASNHQRWSSSRMVSSIVLPTMERLFALSLSMVSCAVCQKELWYPYSRSITSADGTPRRTNDVIVEVAGAVFKEIGLVAVFR